MIFFDTSSTTPCSEEVAQILKQYACEDYGNPSSSHSKGTRAARAIREAKRFFGEAFRVQPEQVIFTGSGTEANNLAIYGTQIPLHLKGKKPQVFTSTIEHPSILKTAESLRDFGISVNTLPVKDTSIDLSFLDPQTSLLSIQQVNSIVGLAFPIEDLAREAKRHSPGLIFHTDAVQAFGKISVPTSASSVDLVSISAHKLGGPKGVGALIVLNPKLFKAGLRPLIWGGGQENGLRSGTQSPGLIAAFHFAAEKALATRQERQTHFASLKAQFLKEIESQFTGDLSVHVNSPENSLPSVINFSILKTQPKIKGLPAAPLARLLDERGFAVSLGSACSAKKPEPDPVLKELGLSRERQISAIRMSLGQEHTLADISRFVSALKEAGEIAKRIAGA